MADNKAKYISVAVITEGEQTRAVPGSPANPAPPPQHIWVAGSSCEILMFQLDDDGNAAPTINIQGTTTTLTGPQGPDNSFTYAVDLDPSGNIYALNFVYLASQPTTDCFYSIPVFAADANGDVAPIRNIQGAATGFPAIVAQWSTNPEALYGGICLDGTQRIYAGLSDTILRFAAGATGNATGTVFLQDTSTFGQAQEGGGITSLSFDAARQWIWVTFLGHSPDFNIGFAAYDTNGVRQRLVTGGNQNLLVPTQITTNQSDGTIWVSDPTNGVGFQSFAPSANGNAAPTDQIKTLATGFQTSGIALDTSGNIYGSVAQNSGGVSLFSEIVSYPPGSSGKPVPQTDITGNMTGLDTMPGDFVTFPQQIVVK